MTKTLQSIPIDDLVIDEHLDFRTVGHDIAELSDSIAAFGLLQPIVVAPANGDGKHHVVAGRRRLRAVAYLGRTSIDAIIDSELTSDRAQMIGQIVENLQREDVSALDEARAYAQLGEYDMKQKDIATMVGASSSHVSGRLALLKLPPSVANAVDKGQVPVQVATRLARAPKAVRDSFAGKTAIDDRAVSVAETEYEDQRGRDALVKRLKAMGLPATAAVNSWGSASPDEIAEAAGLTDDDKPKSHSWDRGAFIHNTSFDSEDEFLAAVQAEKPKALLVSGSGKHLRVLCVTSANIDRERKQAQEEMAKVADERRARSEQQAHAFEQALTPIIAAPDKGALIAHVLAAHLRSQLTGLGNVLSTVMVTAERLGWELTQCDPGLNEYQETQHYRDQLIERATKDTTSLVKAILASQRSITPLLEDQGILADADLVASLNPREQAAYAFGGKVDEALLTDEAKEELAKERALAGEEEDLLERIDAETERRVDAELEEQGVSRADADPDELAAMTEEVRIEVEADLDPGL